MDPFLKMMNTTSSDLLAGQSGPKARKLELAMTAGNLSPKAAVQPALEGLKDEHWSVREFAAKLLSSIRDERAVEPLILALKDEQSSVRAQAAEALGHQEDSRALEPLTQALEDEDSKVRQVAEQVLPQIKAKVTKE